MSRYRYGARYVPLQVQNDFELYFNNSRRTVDKSASILQKIKTGFAEGRLINWQHT